VKVGETWSSIVCQELTRTRIIQFAGVSGEYSELHIDEPAARARGHPSVMAHGMFCAALAARAVSERHGRQIRSFEVRYLAPAWPGDTLTAECAVIAVSESGDAVVDVRLTSSNAAAILTARAHVAPPLPPYISAPGQTRTAEKPL
jgi:acyl dehydratase